MRPLGVAVFPSRLAAGHGTFSKDLDLVRMPASLDCSTDTPAFIHGIFYAASVTSRLGTSSARRLGSCRSCL